MGEQFVVGQNFGAALVGVTTAELDFTEQISCYPVDSVELTLIPAEWASIRITLKPVCFAVTAQRLFASFALVGVLQDVVANPANQLRKEGRNMGLVGYPFFLVVVLGVLLRLVHNAIHN